MKTAMKLMLAGVLLATLASTDVFAQGKRKGHDKHHHFDNRHHKRDRDWDDDRDDRYNRHHHAYHRYDRSRAPYWAPAHGHRAKTRYVYFRDYDVYYDYHRGMYVSWTGRDWVYSRYTPICVERVDLRRAVFVDIDYWDDDLIRYLNNRRSRGSISIHAHF